MPEYSNVKYVMNISIYIITNSPFIIILPSLIWHYITYVIKRASLNNLNMKVREWSWNAFVTYFT
jgi:hypothetical protein